MTNEITITAKQVERIEKRYRKTVERYEEAVERKDRDLEQYLSGIVQEQRVMLDMLGIEWC